MRQYKFRVWEPEEHLMMYCDEHYPITFPLEDEDTKVMQFTGLSDKDGEDIYEDDVLEIDYGDEDICMIKGRVIFKYCSWIYEPLESPRDWENLQEFNWNEIKCIGNVYQNPEFLEEMTDKTI
jgi:uncharacterized phage protein (TIGR01671 family)